MLPPHLKQFSAHNLHIKNTCPVKKKVKKINYGIRHNRPMKMAISLFLLIEVIGEHVSSSQVLHARITGHMLWSRAVPKTDMSTSSEVALAQIILPVGREQTEIQHTFSGGGKV